MCELSGVIFRIRPAKYLIIQSGGEFFRYLVIILLNQIFPQLCLCPDIRIKRKFIQVAGQVHKFHQGIRLFNLHSGSEDFPLLFRHALHPSGEEIEFLQTVVCGWFPCQKVRQTIYGGLYIMDFYFRVFLRFLQLGIGFAKFSG